MSRLVLTVDRGNSTLDCRLTGRGVQRRVRLDPADADVGSFLAGAVPDVAAGLSAVPRGLDPVRATLAPLGVSLRVAGVELPCPLSIAYPDPSTLGVDRWVGAVAARERFGDALVVDCGTAVTFNLVRADGRFVGGAIAAGLGTTAAALATRAPALPLFDGRAPATLPATSTPDAVRAGVGFGFVALIEGLSARLEVAAGMSGATRIVTGGEAGRLLELGAPGFIHVPDLVHEGLQCLLGRSASGC